MSVQVIVENFRELDDRKESVTRSEPQLSPEKVIIVTMGEVLGVVLRLMSAIIKAIREAGDVGRNYLKSNLDAMHKSAKFRQKAAIDQATGAFASAAIGIGLTGAGMLANMSSMKDHVSNANKMDKIQKAPLAGPSRNVGDGGNGYRIDKGEVAARQKVAKEGGGLVIIERNGAPPSSDIEKDKVLHGSSKNATSYGSEAERERALKIQEELNKQSSGTAQMASILNSQTLPIGAVVDAEKKESAAKAQHASDIENSINESVRTLQNENNSFYGALSSLLDKLGITNLITQTIIAASQWK